ncbi:septal ring lytic transglycosylase RlpA family protein [Stenotrophobium rhamnosiphilum]|uniref:Endolytic peptidoglycan transglycosylase RlpA n=1 Tax=Stenotrophobium rhamnosiphilum TaxID=2029166 RepID=A0A2T5MDI6_9GAMM|nr:septal ring lytic transglycosylase RlpA family protein [Stenotrophobium rhamnosiphilum]PTU30636.1 septal ring lytic transglycosylase RlpA family lipoprotein [Stenotrophobium rhamnosiphilum]
MRLVQRSLLLMTVLTLVACTAAPPIPTQRRPRTVPTQQPHPPRTPAQSNIDGPAPSWQKDFAPDDDEIPPGIENTPDAVPIDEPRSRGGNSKTYEVLGKTYSVMDDAKGFTERGHASWYGKKFHGRKTANGERYDMFQMSAAHKSLPIPSYVRVTDLDTNKSAIVRVNDRGPFHGDRIIDLSYAAAAKIGLIGHGTSLVEITALAPGEEITAAEPAPIETASVSATPVLVGPMGGYLQIGAYIDPINAANLRDSLISQGFDSVQIRTVQRLDAPIHRVLIGPFRDQDAARNVRNRLDSRNLIPQWVKE